MTDTGIPSIYPALRYANGQAAIDWLCGAFGFQPHVVHRGQDGSIAHAELQMGTAVIGISSIGPVSKDNPWSQVAEGIYVCAENVDALHDRAKGAGAEIVMPLKNQDYGSRDFSFRDPGGHLWSIGTYREGNGQRGDATLFVGLHYDDGAGGIRFLSRALGFSPIAEIPGSGNTIMHAEMRLGSDVVMLGSTPPDDKLWKGRRQYANVYVSDPDVHCARAKAAGANIVRPLEDTNYGARMYAAHDLEGFIWVFSTYKPSLTAEATRS